MKGNVLLLFPVLIPILGSFFVRIVRAAGEQNNRKSMQKLGDILFTGLVSVTFVCSLIAGILALRNGSMELSIPEICGFGINFTMNGFRAIYVMIASFAWLVSGFFAVWYLKGEEHQGRYAFYTLITLGATLAVFLSADLYTTFIFFEMMSLASYVWVVHEEDEESLRAGNTYLAVAVIGGLVMLMGIFILYVKQGTVSYQALLQLNRQLFPDSGVYTTQTGGALLAATLCLLFGFAAKAGAFPLHIWLPKAHPVAPAPASALLSGILTKAGMYGILLLFGRMIIGDERFGQFLLIIAVCTMLVGAVLALFSIDMKHILACSSVSQIGFVLVGVANMCILQGERPLAIQGSILHMVNHSMFKLILFLLAGIVVKNLKSRDLNVLRGFGVGRPWFLIVFMFAALGIAGVPGFSGFVSKSMLHESIVACYHESGMAFYKIAEILFLIAGGCTLAYMLKLFIVLFFAKPSKEVEAFNASKKAYLPVGIKILLSVPALFIYLAGSLPEIFFLPLAKKASDISVYTWETEAFRTFSWENVKGGLISIAIGVVLYAFVVRFLVRRKQGKDYIYVNRYPKALDLENQLYRPVLLRILPSVLGGCCKLLEMIIESVSKGIFATAKFLFGLLDKLPEMGVIATRRTALMPVCEVTPVSFADRICNGIGHVLNFFAKLNHKLFRRGKAKECDYVEKVNRGADDLGETIKLVSRSLSYGLLAFCIGLLVMLGYLLYCL